MRSPTALFTLLASLVLSSCGTGVVSHQVAIEIEDPGGRLGPPPYQLSVFDPQMGRSEEWARKTMGTAAPGAAFSASYDTVETKAIGDQTPPRRIAAALWLPAYERTGYFALMLEPSAASETTVELPFVPWGDPDPDGPTVAPLTARVRGEPADGAWSLHLTIRVP